MRARESQVSRTKGEGLGVGRYGIWMKVDSRQSHALARLRSGKRGW
jgi:hypothetical protein